ncbi:MAG: Maf family protein [Propionibacteriaceae bacterium]|nr:Maf family protein [Propionibacteriaceae bacterium]
MIRVILASKSPARLATLRAAGIEPVVLDAGVDERAIDAPTTAELVAEISRHKGEAALAAVLATPALAPTPDNPVVLLAADTMLDVDGTPEGKPGTPAVARRRLAALSGTTQTLFTGHFVALLQDGREPQIRRATAATTVRFATLDEAEMDAYAASGEPEQVAGSFTIDALGGPFIAGLDGDPHNVVGISLPLLRLLLRDLGVAWPSLWH